MAPKTSLDVSDEQVGCRPAAEAGTRHRLRFLIFAVCTTSYWAKPLSSRAAFTVPLAVGLRVRYARDPNASSLFHRASPWSRRRRAHTQVERLVWCSLHRADDICG
jgi:hypothetical protein